MLKGTAIETPIKISVRLTVLKDKSYVKTPHFNAHVSSSDDYYCTTGVGEGQSRPRIRFVKVIKEKTNLEMREATRDAVRHMITFLIKEHGLDKIAAYMLCSVAGDLRLHEVVRCFHAVFTVINLNPFSFRQVDMPNYVVSHHANQLVRKLKTLL